MTVFVRTYEAQLVQLIRVRLRIHRFSITGIESPEFLKVARLALSVSTARLALSVEHQTFPVFDIMIILLTLELCASLFFMTVYSNLLVVRLVRHNCAHAWVVYQSV